MILIFSCFSCYRFTCRLIFSCCFSSWNFMRMFHPSSISIWCSLFPNGFMAWDAPPISQRLVLTCHASRAPRLNLESESPPFVTWIWSWNAVYMFEPCSVNSLKKALHTPTGTLLCCKGCFALSSPPLPFVRILVPCAAHVAQTWTNWHLPFPAHDIPQHYGPILAHVCPVWAT